MTTKSVKVCAHHCDRPRIILRRIFAALLIFLFIVLLTILIVWAVLQPKKPSFILQDATVYAFNTTTSPNLLTCNFQVTVYSRNRNHRVGVYYDRLNVYATYHDQQITLRASIPPTYQGHHEVNIWSPFVYGTNVPVAPYNAEALRADQQLGSILVMIRLDGRVRWKVGAFVSGRYHLYVRCPAVIYFGGKGNGVVVGENAVKYQLVQSCSVTV